MLLQRDILSISHDILIVIKFSTQTHTLEKIFVRGGNKEFNSRTPFTLVADEIKQ